MNVGKEATGPIKRVSLPPFVCVLMAFYFNSFYGENWEGTNILSQFKISLPIIYLLQLRISPNLVLSDYEKGGTFFE